MAVAVVPAVLWLNTTGEGGSGDDRTRQSIIWETLYAYRLYSNVVCTQGHFLNSKLLPICALDEHNSDFGTKMN